MRRAERLFRLVTMLRGKDISRAEDLAVDLEVSVRTIYRDIVHLQGPSLPIQGEAGVGYILRRGFDLPAMTFTFEQMDALAIGLQFVLEAGDRELVTATKEVMAKLAEVLPEERKDGFLEAPLDAAFELLISPSIYAMRSAINLWQGSRTRRRAAALQNVILNPPH